MCRTFALRAIYRLRRSLFALSLVVAVVASFAEAFAQGGPPMGGLSQMYNANSFYGQYFDQRAHYYGQLCAQQIQRLRASGYYGPVDCGANAATLQQHAQQLNNSYGAFNQSGWLHQQTMSNGASNYGRALLGQPLQYHRCWTGAVWVWC